MASEFDDKSQTCLVVKLTGKDKPNGGDNVSSQAYQNEAFTEDDYEEVHEPHTPHSNIKVTEDVRNQEENVTRDWDIIFPEQWDKLGRGDMDTFWKVAEKLLTVAFITFIFVTVLGTGLISRVTLHLLIWHLHPPTAPSTNINDMNNSTNTTGIQPVFKFTDTKTRTIDEKWIWSIFIVIVIPYAVSILSCLKKVCLKRTCSIQWGPLLLIFVIESLHSVSLCCLVFIVLPAFNAPTASLIYLAVTLVLPLLDLNRIGCSCSNRRRVYRIFIIASGMLLQWGAVALTCVYILRYSENINGTLYCIIFAVSSIILSAKYWENFTGVSKSGYNMQHIKLVYQSRRIKMMLLVNLLKTVISFISVVVIHGIEAKSFTEGVRAVFNVEVTNLKHNFGSLDFGIQDSCSTYVPFVISIINVCSSYACAKASKTACVIGCQRLGFALPLIIVPLVIPFALTGLMYEPTILKFTDCDLLFSYLNLKPLGEFSDIWPIVASGMMFYISLLCTTWYIWRTNGYKLGRLQRMFVTPSYCGIHTELSLLLNRKQSDEEYDAIVNMVRDGGNNEEQAAQSQPTIPIIYACATMWHETEKEMTQLLKSLFRMDKQQHALKEARTTAHAHSENDPIDYDFEAHIFFDDAFEAGKGEIDCSDVNDYVKSLINVIDRAASEVHHMSVELEKFESTKTPYGGRLKWTMLGGNSLVVHLKDKSKIRHRKRWSQVMYMYYFLGFNLHEIENDVSKSIEKASNTYLLALDGDVDFKPEAVMHLVRRMKKNPCVGAACGRIHPIGNGPMIWYQKFEYAISHWLQKATEHVTGCVLCSPGCFSLFRGSALIGVLKTYTTKATAARHFIQYDQGEDRWLCTLLLKDGYRVEYCAESDSYTFAPESFYEFYNQRRRWSPSTMGNIIDLLMNWRQVVKENNSISRLYMLYQFFFFISSLLTPGTIFLMIVGAIITAFPSVPAWLSLTLNIIPVGLFLLSCLFLKTNIQLLFAGILSAIYSITMILVLVGIIKVAAEDGFCSTTTIFLCFVVGVFLLSALLHPKEASNVVHGVLYLLCIPSMSMLLMLYSLGNLHVVSWGTREVKSQDDPVKKTNNTKKEWKPITEQNGYTLAIGKFFRCICCPTENESPENSLYQHILQRLDGIENATTRTNLGSVAVIKDKEIRDHDVIPSGDNFDNTDNVDEDKHSQKKSLTVDFRSAGSLSSNEESFWENLIEKYLKPLDKDEAQEKRIKDDLIALRNKCCLFFFLLNTFLVTLVYALTQASAYAGSLNINIGCSGSSFAVEPISITFTIVFGVLLVVQFFGLLWHRISTLIHIVASTSFNEKRSDYSEFLTSLKVLQRWKSSSTMTSETSTHTDDYAFKFNNRKQRTMSRNMDTMLDSRPKTLDDIVRKNLRRLRSDCVEGTSNGNAIWVQMFRELNVKRNHERTALRNAYPKLQTVFKDE